MSSRDGPPFAEREEGVACRWFQSSGAWCWAKCREGEICEGKRCAGEKMQPAEELTEEVLVAVTQLKPELPLSEHVLDQEDPIPSRR